LLLLAFGTGLVAIISLRNNLIRLPIGVGIYGLMGLSTAVLFPFRGPLGAIDVAEVFLFLVGGFVACLIAFVYTLVEQN